MRLIFCTLLASALAFSLNDDGVEADDEKNCRQYVYNDLARAAFCVVNSTWAPEFVRRVQGATVGWEPRTRALIHAALAGGQNRTTTLEAGMHVGDHLLPMAASFPRLRFVGVDPDASKCEFVRAMAKANSLENVRVCHHGLAARDHPCALDSSDPNSGGWTVGAYRGAGPALACRSVDSFLAAVPDVALLHLDVEGAELRVLRGATATLRDLRPLVVFENNHLSNATKNATVELLQSNGYEFRNEAEHNEFWAPAGAADTRRHLEKPRRPPGPLAQVAQLYIRV